MNSNTRVRNFVLVSIGIYLLLSLAASWSDFPWLVRINLVGNIMRSHATDSILPAQSPEDTVSPIIIEKVAAKNFELYTKAQLITSFNSDTTRSAMPSFAQKLHDLKTGKKRKIRIGYFGDSMIEGDLMSQTLRQLLQAEFGGYGVGFIPMRSNTAGSRQSAYEAFSHGWTDNSFKDNSAKDNLYISGHSFHSNNDWTSIRDQTIKDSGAVTEKSILCGFSEAPVIMNVDNNDRRIDAPQPFNRIVLRSDAGNSIRVALNDPAIPLYGLTFESASGIIVDNYSFRGISGVEFNKLDSNFIKAIAKENNYDLIIFQYGVNVLFRPNDRNFNWYAKTVLPAIKKLKNGFPDADFLVMSTADRAFNYDGEYRSAIGIDSLIKIQATLAYETHSNFYNQFETMGGHNSIVEWANVTPSLANKDYLHPNWRGAAILAGFFFDALMRDYNKYKIKP